MHKIYDFHAILQISSDFDGGIHPVSSTFLKGKSNLSLVTFWQFMRPRSRDKKLHEEWGVPLKSVEDIYEV